MAAIAQVTPLLLLFARALHMPTSLAAPADYPRFTGGLMGVSADVTLCEAEHKAVIKLSGVPLGGTLRGSATFADGEGSSIVVHEPLRSALRRRFVRIVGAEYDRAKQTVFVKVKLPFLLGTHTIALARARAPARECDVVPLL
jgi:hypothetical protein